jgi:cardiolipin synthase
MLYQARFYEKYPGSWSNEFAHELINAHHRGVDITAIIERADWNPDNTKQNKYFAQKLAAAGIRVYFDPLNITSHQKIMLVDDEVTVIGSANWSHYSLTKNYEAAIVIFSPQLYKAYLNYFNQRLATADIFHESLTTPSLATKFYNSLHMLPAQDVKTLNNRNYFSELHFALRNATKRIRIVQMEAFYYMVTPKWANAQTKPGEPPSPTNQIFTDLCDAKKRGLDVQVILDIQSNRRNANEDFANRLLARGIDVYYDSPTTTTHAKMILIDDHITILGSTNWSYPALAVGNETSVLIISKQTNAAYQNYFDQILQSSIPVADWKPIPQNYP